MKSLSVIVQVLELRKPTRMYRIIDDVRGILADIPVGLDRDPYALRVGNKVLDSIQNIMREIG